MTESTDRLDRIEAALDRMAQFQETEAAQWRKDLKDENADWKEGIEDAIGLVSTGQRELGNKIDALGTRLEAKFDQLIEALIGINQRN